MGTTSPEPLIACSRECDVHQEHSRCLCATPATSTSHTTPFLVISLPNTAQLHDARTVLTDLPRHYKPRMRARFLGVGVPLQASLDSSVTPKAHMGVPGSTKVCSVGSLPVIKKV